MINHWSRPTIYVRAKDCAWHIATDTYPAHATTLCAPAHLTPCDFFTTDTAEVARVCEGCLRAKKGTR